MGKKYVVCIDSDGCAINSMNGKHMKCFGPAFATVWELGDRTEEAHETWNKINLFSMTRGINRFKGLALILDAMGVDNAENVEEYYKFAMSAAKLSDAVIEEQMKLSTNPIFAKALRWSAKVNECNSKQAAFEAFDYVRESLDAMKDKVVIAVVSSANKHAIEREWTHNGIIDRVEHIYSQSEGSKKDCIKKLMDMGYEPENMIMIGDAPGDNDAAKANGVYFYPILAGRENESWKEFYELYLDLFLSGGFNAKLQKELDDKLLDNLLC